MWDLGHLSTPAGQADARLALVIRGLALGFLFTPINNVAFGSLKPHEAQQASGLINLSRQLGGSFGIAVLTTYLAQHVQYHRAELVSNLYAGNPAFEQRLRGILSSLASQGVSAGEAQRRAYATLEAVVRKQSSMLAYNDAWIFIMLSFLCVVPAVFVLRKPGGRAAPTDAH